MSCGLPPVLNHTWMMYNGTTYGDTVTYGCDEGYYRTEGDSVRVCLDNKLWNGTDLICQRKCTSTVRLNDRFCEGVFQKKFCRIYNFHLSKRNMELMDVICLCLNALVRVSSLLYLSCRSRCCILGNLFLHVV